MALSAVLIGCVRAQECAGAGVVFGGVAEGKPDELVDARAAQLVDPFCNGLLLADEGGVLRAGVALASPDRLGA
jgi:hypothetical protein